MARAGASWDEMRRMECEKCSEERERRNRVVAEFEGREDDVPADNSGEPVVGRMSLGGMDTELRRFGNLVPMTDATGDFDELPLLGGQGIGLVTRVEPAAQIISEMTAGARALL